MTGPSSQQQPRAPHHHRGVPRHRARRAGHAPAERVWLVVGILCIGLVLVVTAVVDRVRHRGEALPHVELAGVDVGGLDEPALLAVARTVAAARAAQPVAARAGATELAADPSALGATYEAEAGVRAARRAGRTDPITAIVDTFRRRARPDRIALPVTIDAEALAGTLDGWQRRAGQGLVDGGIRIRGTAVDVVEPRPGRGIIRAEAERRLRTALEQGTPGPVILPMGPTQPVIDRRATEDAARRARAILARPVVLTVGTSEITVPPASIGTALRAVTRGRRLEVTVDTTALRSAIGPALAAIETPPRDADFAVNGDRVSVVPSVTGQQVDLARVVRRIADGTHRIRATLAEVAPTHDTAWAERLHITRLVSSYTTQHPCCQPRVTNIHVAAAALNGAIVEPGQTFSLNQRLGPRTLAKGYVTAPQIAANLDYEDSVGGGVSQLSTTLFNAVFFGGYQDVTHTVHALYISRYPMGREATLNYPSIDNRFRNDTRSGVLIRTAVSGTSVTVSLYGDNEGRTVRAEGPNVLQEIPVAVEYSEDPTVPAGTERELSPGHVGYVVENFRIIRYADGTERRQRFVERYQMAPRKVARAGTAAGGPTGATGVPPSTTPTTVAPPPTTPPSTTP